MGKKKSTTRRALTVVPDAGNMFGCRPAQADADRDGARRARWCAGHRDLPGVGRRHRAMEAWALGFGPIVRWGIEGASGLGRHTAMYLIGRGHDVRDVCPTRTAEQSRRRRQGKTDALDSVRIARETQADPAMPTAFKRAGGDAGPDETHELMPCGTRRAGRSSSPASTCSTRPSTSCGELPEELRAALPDTTTVRPRLRALADARRSHWDPATTLRLRLLDGHADRDRRPRRPGPGSRQGSSRTRQAGRVDAAASCAASPSGSRPSCSSRSATLAGSPARAASPASTAPPRSRLLRRGRRRTRPPPPQPGGNRRVNACLHRMAVTQLRCDPRARKIYDDARRRGHTKKEAMRILKRHLSDVVYRRMTRDLNNRLSRPITTTSAPPLDIGASGRPRGVFGH